MRKNPIEVLGAIAMVVFLALAILVELFGPKYYDEFERRYETQTALDTYIETEPKSKGFEHCIWEEDDEEGHIDTEDVYECDFKYNR